MFLWLLLIVFTLIWRRFVSSAMQSWSVSFNWNVCSHNKQWDSTSAIILIILIWSPNKNPTQLFSGDAAMPSIAIDFISATRVLSVKDFLSFLYFFHCSFLLCLSHSHCVRFLIGVPVGPLPPFFLKILLSRTFENSGGVMVRWHFPKLALPNFDFVPPSTPLQSSPIRQSSREDIRPLARWVGKLLQC